MPPVSRQVIGCAFLVSNTLGAGFAESVCESALCIELAEEGIPFERHAALHVSYEGRIVGSYFADMVVDKRLLLELKALRPLTCEHEARVMSYLRASGLAVGLLPSFGAPRLEIRRVLWGRDDAKNVWSPQRRTSAASPH